MFSMILKDLRISPMRTFLTGLSMFVGILAIIFSVVAGSLAGIFLEEKLVRDSGRKNTYQIGISDSDLSNAESLNNFLTRIAELNSDMRAVSFTLGNESLLGQEDSQPLAASFSVSHTKILAGDYDKIHNFSTISGGWFTAADKAAGLEIVVNEAAFRKIDPERAVKLASRANKLASATGAITGVVFDGSDEPCAYISAASLLVFAPQLFTPQDASIIWHNTEGLSIKDMELAVSDILFDTVGGNTGTAYRTDQFAGFEEILSAMQFAVTFCASLLLVVAAIGLINIGLSAIEQRSRELLIRRALGAAKSDLIALVIGSSLLLSVLVAIAAIAISVVLFVVAVYALSDFRQGSTPIFPCSAAAAAVAAAFLTGLIGSLVPALKAASLEPALALR